MVKVGEVYWVARVEGQGKASAAASKLQDDMGGVAETSEKAASGLELVTAVGRSRQAESGKREVVSGKRSWWGAVAAAVLMVKARPLAEGPGTWR